MSWRPRASDANTAQHGRSHTFVSLFLDLVRAVSYEIFIDSPGELWCLSACATYKDTTVHASYLVTSYRPVTHELLPADLCPRTCPDNACVRLPPLLPNSTTFFYNTCRFPRPRS